MIRSWPFILLAPVLAAMTAGALVGLEFAVFGWIVGGVAGSPSQGVVAMGMLAGLIASLVFLVGLIFPGAPVWLWLHRTGRRSHLAAALAVAIGASVGGIALTASTAGWWALAAIGWLGLPGAVAGLVLRSVAYAPPRA